MKVLQIINSLGTGGAEKLLLDSIPLYVHAGIEMDILLLWDNNSPFTQKLKSLSCCRVFILCSSDNYKDIYRPSAIWKIRTYIKEYDIAHVHLFPAQYYVALANKLIGNKCKLIFTEHNTSNNRINNKIFKPIERYIYKAYQKIGCITQEIYDIYSKYLGQSKQLIVIENGVDINKIKQALPIPRVYLSPELQSTDVLLVQVSAFRLQKDQKTLIRAMSDLPQHYKLLLIGEGDQRESCETLVKNGNLEKRVFFLGQRMDIANILKTSDLIVLSSHYEGLSLASIEAMASGKPLIASDVPGLKEVVKNGGVLFEKGNAKELAEKIKALLTNKDLYNETVKKCILKADKYDINLMVDKYINIYNSIS